MSLIKCSECGNEISDKASACPHCGSPVYMLFDIGKYEVASNYEVKKCVQCGRNIPKVLGKCPYCGKNQKTIAEIIGVVILVIILLGIMGITR